SRPLRPHSAAPPRAAAARGRGASAPDRGRGGVAQMTAVDPRIVLDPAVLAGKPVVRGTRLSVEFIIGLMADGWSEADILANYSGLTHDDIAASLATARVRLHCERAVPSP